MNILFLSRLFYPHIGGVEKHVGEVGKRLVKGGHKVIIVTTRYEKELASKEKIDGVEVVRFFQPKIKFFGLIYTWLWFLKNINLIRESDIIHCHDVFIWYLPFRFLFPKKPVYTTFHGWEGVFPVPKKNIFLKVLSNRLSLGSICVGKYIEKYYGVKADVITYGAARIPSKFQRKNVKSIVYVGRLDKDTGLPVFLKTLSKLPGYTIDFCGDGFLTDECMRYGKVHSFTDPEPFLLKARFCFAGGYLSIMEALAYKCIVLAAYDNSLKRDYFKLAPFSKWVVTEKSPYQISNKIGYYYKNEEECKKIIEQGYNWVRKQTWENLSKTYLKLWGVKIT